MICFRRPSARDKAIARLTIIALIGGIVLYVASVASMAELSGPIVDRDTLQLRSLKTSAVSQLAEFLDGSVVQIPSGEFTMGSHTGREDESPPHLVYLDGFEIDRYEVTNIQYQRFLRATGHSAPLYWVGSDYPSEQDDYPVAGVGWDNADAYCRWVGKRLPTEAEWEKACRGTDGRDYPWGNAWDPRRANVDISVQTVRSTGHGEYENSVWDSAWQLLRGPPFLGQRGLRPVGSYANGASPNGVMDLVGNVSEWVADWYNWGDYSSMPSRNPFISGPPWNHCLRGSAWQDPAGTAAWVVEMSRCSARSSSHADVDPRVGFRCAR